jgi:hypothetical protein
MKEIDLASTIFYHPLILSIPFCCADKGFEHYLKNCYFHQYNKFQNSSNYFNWNKFILTKNKDQNLISCP